MEFIPAFFTLNDTEDEKDNGKKFFFRGKA